MGRRHLGRFAAMGAALLGAGLFLPARAQDPDDQKRGVARISLMNGEVSVRRGDSGDWVAGVINAPLLTDDRISTGPNSRAEVQFDSSNMLRIGGNAEIRLADIEYNRYQTELAKGTMTFRVLRASGANMEVDTPSVSVRPAKVGIFRISVNENGETEVMSRAGDLEIFTPRGSQWISAGQMMVARGTSADPEFQIVGARPADDWDRWNEQRDQHFMQSQSDRYVDPGNSGIYGTEDLDSYGVWSEVPNYGPVWRPTVGADWAPYRAGRWVWEDWYGWTWVSYDPWGWAPYHYGRWFFDAGFGWCWYPGARGYRHFWSPALVGWFGYGGGVGFGFGFGNVGWVPLAPFETFHPWWGRGFYGGGNFGRNINITNVNITNTYRNARIGNGVSGMAAGDFREGRYNSVGRVSGEQMRSAGLVRGQMPIGPTSRNLSFSNRAASFTPRTAENTRFFTHQTPAANQRIPFSQQQRAMGGGPAAESGRSAEIANRPQANGSRPQGASPSTGAVQAARPGQNGASGGGWRRFGEPASGNGANGFRNPATENSRPSQAPGTGGWQRFGTPNASRNPPAGNAPRTNSAPAQRNYNAPAQRSTPSYSAPRGGGGNGASRASGGGTSSSSKGRR
ncbi:MAG: FecR domain-containing protein [Candidatus Sulfopaludibacter sp.]|nr:FecR domain-containing protein [Candidatus Sulfopaludibacter sp.]